MAPSLMWVLIDLANFGFCHSMDFAISTRTPLQAILTSLQTSYRLLSRRGSQTVSIEQAQFFPSILGDIHGLLKRTTQNGKMLLHRSADQGNVLREVYRQHGTSNLQNVGAWFRRHA